MCNWNIGIIVCPGAGSGTRSIQRILTAAWNSVPGADFKIIKVHKLDQSMIEKLDAAVLLTSATAKQPKLVLPLTELDDQHVPVMALLDGPPEPGGILETAGVLIEDRSTNGLVLCARLHGMLHRQREVNRLRDDLAMSGLSHTGLGDEVAKMHDELQLAAQAQRELLPRELPALHGASVATLWRPAQYVSGDIYDIQQLDDDRIGLFLADAVGHGVSAALMTMVLTQSLTTREPDAQARAGGSGWRILEAAEVLNRLNRRLIDHCSHRSRFSTAVYAVVDCRRHVVTIATAGHPPPILVRAGGLTEVLKTSGGLLGIFDEHETYEQITVQMSPGDRLLLYTDGFEQAFPDKNADGERLAGSTLHYREEFSNLGETDNPQELIEAVCRRLDVQHGSLHQADDLTLLCIQVGPAAEAKCAGDKLAA